MMIQSRRRRAGVASNLIGKAANEKRKKEKEGNPSAQPPEVGGASK